MAVYCSPENIGTERSDHMKTVHVAAAIIKDGKKFLAAQRGYGEFKDGWEFPGGKLEPGETGGDACIREIEEELHVTVGNLDELCTVEHDYDTFHLVMDCFVCEIVSGIIDDSEHENMRWLDADHLWDVDWLPADVKVVKALEAKLA